jgi:Tol biopolymer transport system component
MLDDPLPPLTPHFTFVRYNSLGEFDYGMSDLANRRWDYLGHGADVHIVCGGDQVISIALNGSVTAGGMHLTGVFKRSHGSTSSARLLTPDNLQCWEVSVSPDQTRIAFSGFYEDLTSTVDYFVDGWPSLDLFVMDIDGSNLTQITDDDLFPSVDPPWDYDGNRHASWSPDGAEIVFDSYALGGYGSRETIEQRLEVIRPDGTGRRVLFDSVLSGGYSSPRRPNWSPDGRRILFNARPPGESDIELLIIPVDYDPVENNSVFNLTSNDEYDAGGDWSHDGRYVIFETAQDDEEGAFGTLTPFYVINSYTGEVVAEMGDFAKAGAYGFARFTATEYLFTAVEGAETDASGNVIIDSGSDHRLVDSPSSNNYYRQIIPVANSSGINFSVGSWF